MTPLFFVIITAVQGNARMTSGSRFVALGVSMFAAGVFWNRRSRTTTSVLSYMQTLELISLRSGKCGSPVEAADRIVSDLVSSV